MSCSLSKTKSQMRSEGIIDENDNLINKSKEVVDKYVRYSGYIYNLAISKFGATDLKPFNLIDGVKVMFNKMFFDWVDGENAKLDVKQTPEIKLSEDEQLSEQIRIEQEQREYTIEEIYQKSLEITEKELEERLKNCE